MCIRDRYVHLVFGFAVGVFGIASGPGVVFEQYADTDALFDHIAQGLFARKMCIRDRQ